MCMHAMKARWMPEKLAFCQIHTYLQELSSEGHLIQNDLAKWC